MKRKLRRRTVRRPPPAARQQVLLRAIVGSLVLCAALAPPAAGQPITSQGRNAEARPLCLARGQLRVLLAEVGRPGQPSAFVAAASLNLHSATETVDQHARHGMTAAAGGKQFALQLHMTRAQAGNLLRQQLAQP